MVGTLTAGGVTIRVQCVCGYSGPPDATHPTDLPEVTIGYIRIKPESWEEKET